MSARQEKQMARTRHAETAPRAIVQSLEHSGGKVPPFVQDAATLKKNRLQKTGRNA